MNELIEESCIACGRGELELVGYCSVPFSFSFSFVMANFYGIKLCLGIRESKGGRKKGKSTLSST